MKIVKITNGEVELKDFCTRKLKKEVNKALFEGVDLKASGEKQEMGGMTMTKFDQANDILMVGMINKITINGVEQPVSLDTIDELDTRDTDILVAEINKLTSLPNK